ncbi:MAG TPA: heme o synthase [Acidimicrobiia bacterium]|nr:heme o synthase [Acidimicrobiia bacterium]
MTSRRPVGALPAPGSEPVASQPVIAATRSSRTIMTRVAAYIRLTKPRVIELLLVTAVPPMLLAERGFPSIGLLLAVVVGGALAAGGANTINCWIERDRDQLMRRTEGRPLPRGEVVPSHALVFGIALNVVAFAVLATVANVLAASLTIGATIFYVFVYTIWLKPRTVQNIVIGGAAGAVPALVGWAAVTGDIGAPAVVLFAVVFLWTPAHFWALALKYRDDYAAAGIPMLPVVRGVAATTRQIAGYATVTVATSLALGATTDVGVVYVGVAMIAGALFVAASLRLVADATPRRAIAFFGYSNVYLSLLFAAVAVDALIT